MSDYWEKSLRSSVAAGPVRGRSITHSHSHRHTSAATKDEAKKATKPSRNRSGRQPRDATPVTVAPDHNKHGRATIAPGPSRATSKHAGQAQGHAEKEGPPATETTTNSAVVDFSQHSLSMLHAEAESIMCSLRQPRATHTASLQHGQREGYEEPFDDADMEATELAILERLSAIRQRARAQSKANSARGDAATAAATRIPRSADTRRLRAHVDTAAPSARSEMASSLPISTTAHDTTSHSMSASTSSHHQRHHHQQNHQQRQRRSSPAFDGSASHPPGLAWDQAPHSLQASSRSKSDLAASPHRLNSSHGRGVIDARRSPSPEETRHDSDTSQFLRQSLHQLAESQLEAKKVQADLAETQSLLKQHSAITARLEKEKRELVNELQDAKAEVTALRSHQRQLLVELKTQISNAEESQRKAQLATEAAQSQETSAQQVKTLLDEQATMQAKIAALTRDNASLRQKSAEQGEVIAQRDAEVDRLSKSLHAHVVSSSAHRSHLAQANETDAKIVADLQATVARLEEENSQLLSHTNTTSDKNRAMRREISALQAQLRSYEEQHLKHRDASPPQAGIDLNESVKEIEFVKVKLEVLEDRYAQNLNELRQQNAILEKENEQAVEINKELCLKLEELLLLEKRRHRQSSSQLTTPSSSPNRKHGSGGASDHHREHQAISRKTAEIDAREQALSKREEELNAEHSLLAVQRKQLDSSRDALEADKRDLEQRQQQERIALLSTESALNERESELAKQEAALVADKAAKEKLWASQEEVLASKRLELDRVASQQDKKLVELEAKEGEVKLLLAHVEEEYKRLVEARDQLQQQRRHDPDSNSEEKAAETQLLRDKMAIVERQKDQLAEALSSLKRKHTSALNTISDMNRQLLQLQEQHQQQQQHVVEEDHGPTSPSRRQHLGEANHPLNPSITLNDASTETSIGLEDINVLVASVSQLQEAQLQSQQQLSEMHEELGQAKERLAVQTQERNHEREMSTRRIADLESGLAAATRQETTSTAKPELLSSHAATMTDITSHDMNTLRDYVQTLQAENAQLRSALASVQQERVMSTDKRSSETLGVPPPRGRVPTVQGKKALLEDARTSAQAILNRSQTQGDKNTPHTDITKATKRVFLYLGHTLKDMRENVHEKEHGL